MLNAVGAFVSDESSGSHDPCSLADNAPGWTHERIFTFTEWVTWAEPVNARLCVTAALARRGAGAAVRRWLVHVLQTEKNPDVRAVAAYALGDASVRRLRLTYHDSPADRSFPHHPETRSN